jgi:hypothetical protein
MSTRFEIKFILSSLQASYLRERVAHCFALDRFAAQRGRYPIMTRYYDTPDRDLYRQNAEGEHEHLKVRARKYSRDLTDGSDGFLEAKIKHDTRQRKVRVRLAGPDLLEPARWAASEELSYFAGLLARTELVPSCNIYCEREAFELGEQAASGAVRLNFDTDILALTPDETRVTADLLHRRALLPEGSYVLEIKCATPSLPALVAAEVRAVGAPQTTFSKYAAGVEQLAALYRSWRV